MPTIQQLQAEVDRLYPLFTAANSTAQIALANLNRCVCGKGRSTTGNHCRPLENNVTFPNLASTGDCKEPPFYNNCKTDCCDQKTCVEKVNNYNASISAYNTAKANYDAAVTNKSNFIATDPASQGIIGAAEGLARAEQYKWIFFGIVVVVIAIAAFVYFKWFRK